ncbi:ammonium transporter [Clostridium polyendosporum]|uniref:Ammonium transporter n=1 Tax=Clostridium polyendosporum TaxID=69208 RepID=A0A919RYE2_9CLOT|nr:ammonium transporter [Clostridium polyendosporum]GIM28552.1 ammonium transporter [Clostridium polyendosporum]
MQTSDIVFMIFSTALVMLMTPGLALFYGGMVTKNNILNTKMHSYVAIILISLQWILFGYSLAFGTDHGGLIGGLNWVGLNGVGFEPNADYSATIPHQLFMLFQLMFAIITPALISGAFAERMKFKVFVIFMLLWATFVYDPLAHWVWGVGGWIRTLGALDFAGGNVVHISSGVSGLVGALMLGKRIKKEEAGPHHIPLTVLGAGLLWFGWFGFNAGSALGVNGEAGKVAVNAFLTTNTSAAAAALGWIISEGLYAKRVTVMGAVSGAVAGLVSITPGAGYVTPMASIIIGLIGGVICYFAVAVLKEKLGYDDALDAFGCHGIGGTWGAIATGIFATKSINSAGADGVLAGGNWALLGSQIISVVATYAFAAAGTFVILKGISFFTSIRVEEEEEKMGLDLAVHGEKAYGKTFREQTL